MSDTEAKEGRTFRAWLNPLQFLEVEEPWASIDRKVPAPEAALSYICTPGISSDVESIVERYREISQEKVRLIAAPSDPHILDRLVWPLRHAKACYMVGNYLGTISLCGMVAEMVAILTFKISDFKLNESLMTAKDEEQLFGRSFEELNQYRRIQILRTSKLIREPLANNFLLISNIRNKYLHLWSEDHAKLPEDAVKTYNATLSIVVKTIGQDIKDGMIRLNPALVKYLEHSGIIESEPTDES